MRDGVMDDGCRRMTDFLRERLVVLEVIFELRFER